MNVVIIYDLDNGSDENRVALFQAVVPFGYRKGWTNPMENNRMYNLPKNSFFKMNITLQEAYNEFVNIAARHGFLLVRCIVLPSAPWVGMVGKNY